MTDLIKRDDALLPCPFCGGEASDGGLIKWSRALPDTHWDDGSEITKAYFCNCISCSVTNIVGNVGYRTKAEAIAAWNTRAADCIEELETRNKELTLQLLATSGQAADALDRAVIKAAVELMGEEHGWVRREKLDKAAEVLRETTQMLSQCTFTIIRMKGQYFERLELVDKARAVLAELEKTK